MYRMLSLRNLSRQRANRVLSAGGKSGFGVRLNPELTCFQNFSLLCNQRAEGPSPVLLGEEILPNKLNIIKRVHSTTTTQEKLDLLKKKKRKKSNSKKFTELLKVTDTSTKQTKTSIQNLKAQKLADFINNQISQESIPPPEEPVGPPSCAATPVDTSRWSFAETPVIYIGKDMKEVELSNETLAEILESYRVLKDLHERRQATTSAEEAGAEEELIEEVEVVEPMKGKGKSSRGKKEADAGKKFASKYYKNSELESLARQKSFHFTLHAYLDICLTTGMINRAYATVLNYRHKRNRKCLDVEIYNILMHGYAEKGNLLKLKDIMKILKEDSIEPNAQTYAAIFECLGRLETTDELRADARTYLQEAQAKGFSMNDIMDRSKFTHDQRETVLCLFRELSPGFNPSYTAPALHYNNHLLNALNEHVPPIDGQISTGEPMAGSEIMASKAGFSREQLEDFSKAQVELELKGHLTVKSIQKFPEPTETVKNYRKELEELRKVWTKQITAALHRDVNTLKAVTESKTSRAINLFPYLKSLSVAQYTEILLDEAQMLIEGSDTFSIVTSHLHRELGKKVEARYHVEQKRTNGVLDKTCEVYNLYCDALAEGQSSDNPRQLWQRLVHENRQDGASLDIQSIAWPRAAVNGVGKFLYNVLKNDLKINVNATARGSRQVKLVPAFYSLFRYEAKVAKEQIKPHPVLIKLYRNSQQDSLKFDINLVPMLCPPQPWSTAVNGGYILAKSDLIRLPQQAHQQSERIAEASPQDMYPTLDALNQLGSIPWKINDEVLDVVLAVFNKGGNSKLDVPEPPASLAPIEETIPRNEMTGYDRFNLMRKKMTHRRKQGDMYSLWCDALYRLSLANHFRGKVFWLPQNIDFRGRVYPIPPHLNHLGHDLARCLMVFHQKKPLGPDGFNWLKLHCINLTGLKKRDSVQDRLRYADEIMDDILDSADRPLTGRMWWSHSDEPWQTLACCMEIAKVHRCPNPAKFMSGFPIHQDGSCNGLQHYAALGRDTPGAISVNLAPADVPQDVYSAVAVLVEENRAKDAANNVKVAAILEGFIKRKVIKQTVMTTVYGVTRYGARKQIARQLEYIDEFPKEWVWPASSYLTVKTFNALSEMFTSAKEIQDWFTDCARLISAVCAQNVEWITPLGLPVVQPYNRSDRPAIPSKSIQIPEHFAMDSYEKPNIMKQKNAFPPNFVHSLDSSHMMLTSLYCERAGLTFISVHDCYWTHACTVATMNKICREQFVALHSEPILEDLSKFLVQKYSYDENEITNDGSVIDLTKRKLNRILQQYPDKGDFDLRRVLNSVYFFS
ncbi:DNA-directed RNA polymerase, mitochondrial [Culex quinquefasciatus]|uniref:DNA-directed RNA polymerase n=1 Tax=Culex quinquefasciatus TaxID=7176 RepID=B0W1Q8_CULQU|nr:DNA-directed RNA polymerase, mitochondrial [Culex quinquefasciatus]|eukprot:XP_001842642.1 DNA-directed RNA polymerase, mitochondrial [Culex quinquefasciatus]